jgi:hypothetical protein
MIALLLKDLRLVRRSLVLAVPAMFLYGLIANISVTLCLGGTTLSIILLAFLTTLENPKTSPVLALPILGRDLVASRYVSLILIWLIASLPAIVWAMFNPLPDPGRTVEPLYFLVGFGLFSIITAIALPLLFRYPSMGVVILILILLGATIPAAIVGAIFSVESNGEHSPVFQLNPITVTVTITTLLACYLGSLAFSIRMINRRNKWST